jgi:uncharacterized membrane protein (UPF0182 family)
VTFNVPRPQMPQLPTLNRRARVLVVVVVAVIVLLILGSVFVGQYTNLLWFRSVQYSSVFSRRLVTELLLFFVFGAVMAVVVAANVIVAFRFRPPFRPVSQEQEQLERYRRLVQPVRGWVLAAAVVLIGIITGSSASRRWQTWLLWRNGTSFGVKDAQFHRDVSYFAFTYPMQRFVLGTLFAIVVVSLLAVLVTAYLYGSLRLQTPGPKWTPASRVHVSILLGLFVLLKAVAYWLDRYGLAFSGRGIVTGPSYTDVHAVLPAKTILVFVAIICALLFFANSVTRNWTLPAISFGLMAFSAIVIGGAYPALVQHYKVQPSAQDLEAPYIQRNIDATQLAYGITPKQVSVTSNYPGVSTASNTALRTASTQVAQLRVLDPNVVSQTFEQLQQERSYYTFPQTLDVDRYDLSGKLTDVVIGARDINLKGLQPSQRNWINEHLVYTHGYGLVAAQADTANTEGSPSFVEQDLPPRGPLNITQPRIYFGESSPAYSIVGAPPGTKPRELDRPADNAAGQVNNTYTGGGGVSIGSTWRQLLYAWKFKDKNILLSSGVNSASRILYVRDPRQRVAKVAPWLTLDGDPYPVVVGGQIQWVVDGYTTSDGFPYSEQESLGSSTRTSLTTNSSSVAAQSNKHINYIRNSVKATVNAYTGAVNLYEWNQVPSATNPFASPDPVLKTWEKAFPGVVKPQSAMPAGLISHLRYPEDLFNIQRTLLAHYHVTNPKSFYGGTQFWNVPNDPTTEAGSASVPQPAYYLSLSPDGSTTATPTFSLTSPLVSLNRRNLTAFLSVDSQPGADYGQFQLLELPDNQVTDGPQQVQNNIESTTAVSTQLTLLRQGGSRVALGNLLTVPIDGGLLYVEPIYVQSAGAGSFPELREVAAVYSGTVAYQPTLSAALDQVFGLPITTVPTSPTSPVTKPPTQPSGGKVSATLQEAIAQAQAAEAAAKAALRRGDFAAYGVDQKKLQRALTRIAAAAAASSSH